MKTTIKIFMVFALAIVGLGANAQDQTVVVGSTYKYKTKATSTVVNPNAVEYLWSVTKTSAGTVTTMPTIKTSTAATTDIVWNEAGTYKVILVETIVYDNAGNKKRCNNVEEISYIVEVVDNDFEYDFTAVAPEGVCANEAATFTINIIANAKIVYPIFVTYTLPDEGNTGHPSVDHGATIDFASSVAVELVKEAYVKTASTGFYVNEGSDVFDAVLTVTKIVDSRGVEISPKTGNTLTLKVNRNPVKKQITFE